jgi:hypothetical protein
MRVWCNVIRRRYGTGDEDSWLDDGSVTNMPIVILKDVSGNSVLPIWVGIYDQYSPGD